MGEQGRWSRWVWVLMLLLPVLGVGGWVPLYYAAVGFPATPMTVADADRLFGEGLPPGSSWEEVRSWLAAQGIRPADGSGQGPWYGTLWREPPRFFKGDWMDFDGGPVAERAGLRVEDVCWLVKVKYPDAGRGLLRQTEVSVYLFFDGKDRLIKHWAHEFHVMP
jgi:hypothetical protein